MTETKNIAIILCGGSGSRLWPLSTIHNPKQFINLFNNNTLLDNTIERIPLGFEIVLISNIYYQGQISKYADKYTIIYEPSKRNTAPAILSAVLFLKQKYSNLSLNIIVLPSDHYFNDNQFGLLTLKAISSNLLADNIITFGIKPTYPETEYGYIKYNDDRIIKFIEKPCLANAIEYVESGDYLWNSGVFVFNADVLISEFKLHQSDMLIKCTDIITKSILNNNLYLSDEYNTMPDISIDYAIMERTSNAAVLIYSSEWSDLGCWNRVYDFVDKDEDNNVRVGNSISKSTTNSYIYNNKGIITTIGLDNIIIVKNGDDILISHKDYVNDIKSFGAYLEAYHMTKNNQSD